jgi:D-xylose 1-dehydrogenase (NADP+, D-xylono-1,5-lactone-forming)
MDPHGSIDPGGCVDSEGRIGWGVLGAAGVARRRFLPALTAVSNARLVVLGSRSLERAAAAVESIGQGRPAPSYEAVLEDREVDAIYIPLPNALHRQWALKALDAGKHVLCEKPLVLSSSEVDELAEAATSANRVVMEGFMYRFHPQYEQATWRPLLAEIGAVRFADVRLRFSFDRPGDIREDAKLGGGALWDIGSYCLDVLTWQLGEVVEVQALGDVRNGTIWTAATQLRFASGSLGAAWYSFAGPLAQQLTLVGDRGTLDLTSPFRATGPAAVRLEVDGDVRTISLPTDDCFRREIEHFGQVVLGRATPAVPLGDSARWIGVAEQVGKYILGAISGQPSTDVHAASR